MQTACGKKIQYSAETDEELTEDLHKFIQDKGMKVQIGNTVATNDFYEGEPYLHSSLKIFVNINIACIILKIRFMRHCKKFAVKLIRFELRFLETRY